MIAPQNDFGVQRNIVLRRFGLSEESLAMSFADALSLALYIGKAPVCVISLVFANSNWICAHLGMDVDEQESALLFCRCAAVEADAFVVNDVIADNRFESTVRLSSSAFNACLGVPLRDSIGSVIGSLCVLDRPAHTWQAEQKSALRLVGNQIGEMLDLREQASRFSVSRSAHDLNNLFTAIVGYSDLTLSELPIDGNSKTYVQHIKEAAERAAVLTKQLRAGAIVPSPKSKAISTNAPAAVE